MIATTPVALRVSPQDFIEISAIKKFGDGSGYTSSLTVGSGRFSCSAHPFYFDDLEAFAKDIATAYDRVKGKAWIGNRYEKDFVEIEVRSDGHVLVTGFIVEYEPDRKELRFAFGCDQTFLPELLRSLSQVAKELDGKK